MQALTLVHDDMDRHKSKGSINKIILHTHTRTFEIDPAFLILFSSIEAEVL